MSSTRFRLEHDRHDGAVVLRPIGELDVAAAPMMREALVGALRAPGGVLVVDCAGLRFVDSSGLSVLAHAQRRVGDGGGELRLAAVPDRICRVIELAGMGDVLVRYPTVADALGAPLARPT